MRHRKIHQSWLIAICSAGIIGGVVMSAYSSNTIFLGAEWFVISICLSVLSFKNRNITSVILILCSGVIFGMWRGNNELVKISGYDELIGKTVELEGKVAEDPSIDADGDIQVRLDNIVIYENNMPGQIWVSLKSEQTIKRSDLIVVEGQLSSGFGNIPASMYRSEINSINRKAYTDIGRDVRDSFSEGVRTAVQEPEASLATGFLVGQKTALPEKLNNELRLLGLTHIIVASGYNLTILVRFARRFFERISRFAALSGAGLLIFGFMQITGASPSMSRAALITSLSLVAWYFGRKIHPVVLLSFSAALTIVINPFYAWGDIGWLLSFTAFIGVIIFAPLLNAYFWGIKKPGAIRQVVLETFSAQILTLPLIAYIFGQYSILSLLANVLILPLIPLAMLFTFIAGLVGMTFAGIAPIFGLPAEVILRYMTSVINWLSTWPIASSEIAFSKTALIVSYIVLFATSLLLWRKSGYRFRNYNIVD